MSDQENKPEPSKETAASAAAEAGEQGASKQSETSDAAGGEVAARSATQSEGEPSHAASHGADHGSHGADHGSHGAGDHFGHITPLRLLVAVWGALMVLTWITVAATYFDLGSSGNLIIAMVIATVKATLVVLYFMHLRWDKPFNALAFVSSLIFVSLFISIALLDKSEYEQDITDMYELKEAQK